MKDIGGVARGQMVIQLPEDDQQAGKVLGYLRARGLIVEDDMDIDRLLTAQPLEGGE